MSFHASWREPGHLAPPHAGHSRLKRFPSLPQNKKWIRALALGIVLTIILVVMTTLAADL